MTVWRGLRVELLRLQRAVPRVLQSYPYPGANEDPGPPYRVTVVASASAVAEVLHQQFGDDVELRIGAMPFPRARDSSAFAVPVDESDIPVLPEGLGVRLTAPLAVRSGETARASVLVSNDTEAEVVVLTSGQLVGRVVSPSTGMRVGGFAGALRMQLVTFHVPGGGSKAIPLLVGTASFVRALGYSVPSGQWALTVDLWLADGRQVRTPQMTFEIID